MSWSSIEAGWDRLRARIAAEWGESLDTRRWNQLRRAMEDHARETESRHNAAWRRAFVKAAEVRRGK